MASNDVELSEEPQLDSAGSHNPVLCKPDMASGHVRDDPRAGMIRRARSRHRAGIFRKARSGIYAGTSLWIDPERKLALVLLTNRTWPDRANKAIQEVRPAFHHALAEGMASRRRSCAPN
jgi:CubicO group peptidase (beta-lactamase class C family)